MIESVSLVLLIIAAEIFKKLWCVSTCVCMMRETEFEKKPEIVFRMRFRGKKCVKILLAQKFPLSSLQLQVLCNDVPYVQAR